MTPPKTLKEYGDAFKDQRKDYYEALTLCAQVGTFTLLAAWIYLTILILDKLISIF